MRLFYYQSPHGNVGDDLNALLWPKVFGSSFFDNDSDKIFLGIGSIFDDRPEFNSFDRPVVFGSGLRSRKRAPQHPERFDIRFVRGPLSARALGLNGVKYISDPAIISPIYITSYSKIKRHSLGYVPYFMTPDGLNEKVALEIGAKIISPKLSPQDFINEITSCEKIISEAMHGAILADAYRIPWAGCRLMSGLIEGRISLFKWKDWMRSLDIRSSLEGPIPEMVLFSPRKLRQLLDNRVREKAVSSIMKIVKEDRWSLSNLSKMKIAQERINEEAHKLINDKFVAC